MVQTIQIELSINSNSTRSQIEIMLTSQDIAEICSTIQRFNSYNLLIDKVAEKVSWTIYRPDEKGEKSIREMETNFPLRAY